MKFLLKFILVLLIGVAVALIAKKDPGYIIINRSPWLVETSLTFFVFAMLLFFTLLYYLIRFISNTRRLSERFEQWKKQRRSRRGARALTRGLIKLAERQWQAAEKELLRHADDSDTPLLNYLAAASAAQGQDAHERRDQYLYKAHQSMPAADLAVGLTQAELQLRHQQLEQALATLTHLRQLSPRHGHVLKLLMRLYEDLNDWRHLRELLPELRRRRVLNAEDHAALERRVYIALMDTAISSGVKEVTFDLWAQLPKQLRRDEDIVEVYSRFLADNGAEMEAEKLLRETIRHVWSEKLVLMYGQIHTEAIVRQLATAERWLNGHETNPMLLLTLGRLSMANSLWGKARSYLETSLASSAMPETYQALGDLLVETGGDQ